MIMAGTSVKIHEDFSFLQRLQKSFKIKFLQHHHFRIMILFFFAHSFYFGLNIKSVE